MIDHSLNLSSSCAQHYDVWGGFAATVASADDFVTARQADPNLQSLFDKLDRLGLSAGRRGFRHCMQHCMSDVQFSVEDVSRLNSPLLDGL